ncbi:aminoacyl-tRNA hydrolase [Candidatus Aerophobetes bacterium]|uniref:Peptidyl-tRNA hydrolase n=1 Tax=Aerophobetes bacterium TaxID=2030807 RepID=A0A7V5HYK6_UNCAE|nr:aminoacyl-tRNA hydrolase [Candidatus Aerophobetes bacterium]HHF98315.1 aminoacyl-tRNA hydrolase [Candidatus Aerophobetes bacterium]
MKVIMGLGNPGKEYERTRHNAGFLVVDAVAEKYRVKLDLYNLDCLLGKVKIKEKEVLLAKPLTYMNLSGVAARKISSRYKVKVEEMLVVNDDADLELGRIKISRDGGDAGHLGVRSVIENMESKNFPRLRIGIGKPPQNVPLREYVLQEFSPEEWRIMQNVLQRAVSAVEKIITEGIEKAMLNFN